MRSSFVLYSEYADHINDLSIEQRGVLFTAIMNYANDADLPSMDGAVKMAFSFIKKQLDRDNEKYEEKVEKRRNAGRASGVARRNKCEQTRTKRTHVKSVEQTQTKRTDNNDVDVDDNNTPYTPPAASEVREVVEHLNSVCGTRYRANSKGTEKPIRARLNEGFSVEDCMRVIDIKAREWKGTGMEEYLRPVTLFSQSKFEGYLNQAPKDEPKQDDRWQ